MVGFIIIVNPAIIITIIINNYYSPSWRWIVVDIFGATKQQGKYPPL